MYGMPNTHGTAQWADENYIAKKFKYNPDRDFFLGRNPYNYDEAIGYDCKSHVFLCSGTRGGKGRSIVINNLLNWRGSIVAVDPKGENASVCAVQRAQGLGQKTYVLDPYKIAQVPDELRAVCDPLSFIDPQSNSLFSDCRALTQQMRISLNGEGENWSEDAMEFVAAVMAHVLTSPYIPDDERDLITVRNLCFAGHFEEAKQIEKANRIELERAERAGEEPELATQVSGFDLLFMAMKNNTALKGNIELLARRYEELRSEGDRHWASLSESARKELSFLLDLDIEDHVVAAEGDPRKRLDVNDLKDDPNGISVFLCIRDDPKHPSVRWQKMMIALMFQHMRKDLRTPATGRKVLFAIDEFLSMGKTDEIMHGVRTLAGFGVMLFIIATDTSMMETIYDKAWRSILGACDLKIWFKLGDDSTRKHLEDTLGDTQITLYARTITQTQSHTDGISVGQTEGMSVQETVSDAQSETESTSHARAVGSSHSLSLGETNTETWNDTFGTSDAKTRGSQSGWNYAKGLNSGSSSSFGRTREYDWFYSPIRSTNENRGTNQGRSLTAGKSRGTQQSRTITQQSSKSKGGSTARTRNETHGTSVTDTETLGHSSTLSRTYALGRSKNISETINFSRQYGHSQSLGVQEQFVKRPLITRDEVDRFLGLEETRDSAAYPGFALVQIQREHPFLVRKCYYDQDPLFEGKFTPHYAHRDEFLPFSQQRLVGGQYTKDHFVPFRLPPIAQEQSASMQMTVHVAVNEWVQPGQLLFSWKDLSFPPTEKGRVKPVNSPLFQAVATAPGMVVDVAQSSAFNEDGDILLMRFERPFDDAERIALERKIFGDVAGACSKYLTFKKQILLEKIAAKKRNIRSLDNE